MKSLLSPLGRPAQLIVFALLGSTLAGHAADIVKADNTDDLNLGTSWVDDAINDPDDDGPGAVDVAIWDSTVTGANTTLLGADLSWEGIYLDDPGGLVTIDAGHTLTLGIAGIDMSAATRSLAINAGLIAGEDQTWDVGTGLALTMAGAVHLADNVVVFGDGGGTLTLGGNDLEIGGAAAGAWQTMNLDVLDTFVFSAAANTLLVGPRASANGRQDGKFDLANHNTVTVATLDIGGKDQSPWSDDQNNETAQLFLGQTNVLNADTIEVGAFGGVSGLVRFTEGLTDPTLTIRGTAGGDSRADILTGHVNDVYTIPFTKVDLTVGLTGTSTLDARVGLLEISGRDGNHVQSEFIMGAGTLDATEILLSHMSPLADKTYNAVLTGRLRLNGGTVKTETLTFTQDDGWGQADGEFHLTSGELRVLTWELGNGRNKRLYWDAGTIGNYDASSDFTIPALTSFELLSASPVFDVSTGLTGTVDAALSGAGGFTKTGAGTLVLYGLNTHAGDTTVNAGVLAVDGMSIPDGGKLVIDGGMVEPTGTETVFALFFGAVEQATGTWGATGSGAEHIDDTHFSGSTGVIEVGIRFASWITGFGLAAEDQGPTDDPDADSLSNALEWVLGGNPSIADTGKMPVGSTDAGDFLFTFIRDQQSKTPDTSVVIEVGTTLADWPDVYTVGDDTAASSSGVTVTDNGNGTDTVTLTLTRAPDTKKFARLKVTVD